MNDSDHVRIVSVSDEASFMLASVFLEVRYVKERNRNPVLWQIHFAGKLFACEFDGNRICRYLSFIACKTVFIVIKILYLAIMVRVVFTGFVANFRVPVKQWEGSKRGENMFEGGEILTRVQVSLSLRPDMMLMDCYSGNGLIPGSTP